jgi:chromosome segregation ATPase
MKTVVLISLIATNAFAQSSTEDGLNRMKSNYENSEYNVQEYQKNSKIVDENLAEVLKAKKEVADQKSQLQSAFQKNQQGLKVYDDQAKEVQKTIDSETKMLKTEEQKMIEAQAVIQKIKDNQDKRQKNLLEYQKQLAQIDKDKADWKNRSENFKKQWDELTKRLQEIGQVESELKNKQKGYQGEIGRWKREADKNKKLYNEYSNMSQQKE